MVSVSIVNRASPVAVGLATPSAPSRLDSHVTSSDASRAVGIGDRRLEHDDARRDYLALPG